MLYNKNNLRKVEDKKVLRKVKRQWVVMSLASFAFIGGMGAVQQVSRVSADVNTTTTQTPTSGTNSNTSSSGSAASVGTDSGNNQSAAATTPTVDEKVTYQSQITQGQQDAYQNKADASSSFSDTRAAAFYEAAYQGAKAAMAAYTAATQNKGAGTQDYTYYGNTASKLNDDGSTHTSTNKTDGTPQQAGSTDDANQGGANNPTEASSSSSKYENTLNGNLNTASNTSVKGNSTSNQISIPTSKTDTIVAARSSYQNDTNLGTAFDGGVNYALAQYGQQDAETGKWQGVYNASNKSATQDWYLTTNPNSDTTNAYDQAYRGARAAMNQYFDKNNNYLGNGSVKTSTTGNTYYDQGFNDVVSQAAQGIAYVQNGNQYFAVLTGNAGNTGGGNVVSNINTIRLANDIDLTGASNGENNLNVSSNTSTFTIDGQNHMMDAHGNGYIIGGSLGNLYVQNFQTIYGANYFGPFRGQNGSSVHFGNLNYVGPQLLSSYNNDAYFFGNVNVIVPNNSSATYTSPFQSNVGIEGGGNQENLEVKNFVLQSGAHYYGTTSPVKGGTNMVVQGNFTMQPGSKMTLVSRGGDGNAASDPDGSTFGIWLQGSGSALNIQKDATLNIIPSTFNGNSKMIGGGIYADGGAQVTVDGGTINYEGKGGQSGQYNEPIDLKGSNTSIKVINGGLLQVLMDGIPSNAYNTSFYGFVTNYGGGTFNVGSKGSLNIGITNSDSNQGTAYYGPLNINSVGGNHVIITKPAGSSKFSQQPITAYTVAVVQGGQKTYLYQYNLQPGASTYSGIDLNGNTVSGPVTGNTIDIANVPAVQLVGPLTTSKNPDNTTTVTGFAKLSNYTEMNGQPLYVGIATGTSGSSYTDLTQVTGDNLTDGYSSADPYTYTTKVDIDQNTYKGGLIQVSYKLPAGVTASNYLGMRLRYGINSVSTILTPQNQYSTTIEGFKKGSNGKVAADTNGNMVVASGSSSTAGTGASDGITDVQNGNSNAKSAQSFNTQNSSDYLNGYDSAQAGYNAYTSSQSDPTKTAAFQNADNPTAFIQGYNSAAYQAGLKDAQLNKDSGSTNSSYTSAQSDYKAGYDAVIANPAATAPSGASAAKVQGYADAQGVANFFADEQAGTIQTSTSNSSRYSKLTSSQQASYNNAYAGYQQAMKVSPNTDNPDQNVTKAEAAGFDYGQSLINGGYSKTRPTAKASHMNNLNAAQIGYDTAQAAIQKANANYTANPQNAEVAATDPSQLAADNTSDTTFNRYVKFGAYTALKQQSDSGLNQYEEVGYTPTVSTAAYQAGLQAYKSNPSATAPEPTGVAAQSAAGKAAFAQGYKAAQDAAAQGVQNFKSGTADVTGTDTASQITNQASHDASAGFNAANSNQAAAQPNNPSYMAGYNAAQSAKQAIADDKAGNTSPSTTPADQAEYTNAKTAYDAAITAAKNGNTTQSTSSDPVYQKAYNQALDDVAKAKAAAIAAAVANHGQADSSNGTYADAANPAIKQIAQQAYATAQQAYTDTINGNAPTNPTADQKDAVDQATQALKYAQDAASSAAAGKATTSTATPTAAEKAVIDQQVTAAQNAFNSNPDAPDTLNSNDPLANAAYKQAMDDLQDKYKAGIAMAKNNQTPADSADAATKRGASDFNDGLSAAVNGTTISSPNSGTKAGAAALTSFNNGYNDAEKSKNDSTDTSITDPIQKAVQAAATEGFNDAQAASVKSATEVQQMSPVAQLAYNKAVDVYKNAEQHGAQSFLNGDSAPDTNTLTGNRENTGYQATKNGYNDASTGFSKGIAGTPDSNKLATDSYYKKGYEAGKSTAAAIAAAKAGNMTPATTTSDDNPDTVSYNKALQAYNAAVSAAQNNATPPTSTDPVTKAAYDQAAADVAAARAAAIADGSNNNGANTTKQYSTNPTVQAIAQTAYNDAKTAYENTLTGTAVTNPSGDAQAAGIAAANTALAYAKAAANGNTATTPSDAEKTVVDRQIAAAQAAFTNNSNASETLNSPDPLANYAYQQAIIAERAKYDAGVAAARKLQTIPADADLATKQGAQEFNAGLNAAVNGQTVPSNRSQSTVTDAKSAADQGYNDAEQSKDDSKDSSITDPIRIEAQEAATQAFNDAANKTTTSLTGRDAVYTAAYNKAHDAATNGATNGAQAYLDGKARPDTTTVTGKTEAAGYDNAQNGYADAQTGDPKSSDVNYMKGYNAGKAAKQAIADEQNGTSNASASTDPTTYTAAQQAYKEGVAAAAKTGANTPQSTSTNPTIQAAYNQAIADTNSARQAAIADADKRHGQDNVPNTSYSKNTDVQAAASQAYTDAQKAYAATLTNNNVPTNPNDAQQSGIATANNDKSYVAAVMNGTSASSLPTVTGDKATVISNEIDAAQTAFNGNPDASDELNSSPSDPLADYAYKQKMDDLQTKYQAGVAQAKLAQTPDASASDAQKQGASDFSKGLTAAVNNQTITNPNSGERAGMAAAQSFNRGYEDAQNGTDDSNDSDPVKKATQAAASEAYADVAKGTPKTADQINALDPVSKVAYQKALTAAQQDASNGAQAYLNGQTRPDDSTPAGKAEAAGYDAAKAGHDAAENGTQPTAAQSADPNYKAGHDAYTDSQTGYKATTKPADNASQSEKDGYNGATDGAQAALAGQKADLKGKPQAYQDAYNTAYDQTKNGYVAGYAAGQNGGAPDSSKVNDPSYMKGYNAGKAAKQAVTDDQNGTSNASASDDQTTYTNTQAAYAAGVKAAATAAEAGTTTPASPDTDLAKKSAYDQAVQDANTAIQAAIKDADDRHGQDNLPSASYSKNADVQAAANQAYTDAQQAYAATLTNNAPTNPNGAAQTAGISTAKNDKAYVDGTVAGTSASSLPTVTGDKATVVSNAIDTAQKAFNGSPDASDELNSNPSDPLADYAYKQEMKALQAKYKNGYQQAASAQTATTPVDDATAKGVKDFTDGLNSVVNGPAITNPNSGQQAGITAAQSFNKGYEDAEKGTDDSSVNDPVQKAVAVAAEKAFADYKNGTPKTTDQINALDPVSKIAYQKAMSDAENSTTNGTNAFVNGQPRPDETTATGKAAAIAYDKAKQGYEDAKSGQTSPNVDPTDPSYKAGKQAYTDSQTGYDSKNAPAADAPQPTKDAYNGATDGAADAIAGKATPTDLANKSQAYQDAYNRAHSQAQAGIADAMANTTPTDAQKADPNYMAGYNAAKAEIQNGGQTFLNGQNRPDDSTPMGKAAAAGYDASKKGYEDAEAGKTPTADEVNNPAYQVGKKAYTTTTNTAQADALSGNGPQDANLSPVDKAAYDQAYKMTINGFNDGNNGAAEAFPDDPNYQKGYAAAQAIRALFNDKKNNTNTAVTDQADYDLAAKAYQQAVDDVKNGRPMSPNDKNLVYVFAYQQAYEMLMKEKQQQATAATAQVEQTAVATSDDSGLPETRAYKNFAFDNGLLAALAVTIMELFATAKRKKDEK